MARKKIDFDVALSFAGEDRDYVEKVALILKEMGFRVFYDKYETVSLWGKDLYTHLHEIYFKRAFYVVMFISKDYKKKLWSDHERKSAQARAFNEKKEYILPARFDRTQIPGIPPTVGYINLKKYKPKDFALLIKQKIGPRRRKDFFPNDPDRLYKILCVKKSAREEVFELAQCFYNALQLMTIQERRVLFKATINACPCGIPDNAHLDLYYLSRLTGLNSNQLLAVFSRLDCLGIKSRHYNIDNKDTHTLVRSNKIIELKFEPYLVNCKDNATDIMLSFFNTVNTHLCPNCIDESIKNLDFSVLGTLTSFDEIHSF